MCLRGRAAGSFLITAICLKGDLIISTAYFLSGTLTEGVRYSAVRDELLATCCATYPAH